MKRTPFWLLVGGLLALGCGRSELVEPLDAEVLDVPPVDRPDGDVPDVPPDAACRANRDCDDGLFCNGIEECVANRCRPGVAINCDDGVACTSDSCSEAGQVCLHSPNNSLCPGGTCDQTRGCTTGGCTTNAQCDDGDPCTGTELCVGGRCARSMPPLCDDGIGCTVDTCVRFQGCVSRPDSARCDDGDACTEDFCNVMVRSCTSTLIDRDGDGFSPGTCSRGGDCDDGDPRISPAAPEVCGDGRDNDCNGLTDCADRACIGTPACGMCVPTGPEITGCRDGRDNDCNGLVDCADPACRGTPACGTCVPTGPESLACGDGRDNDCDGLTDCADPECVSSTGCGGCMATGPEVCGDGRDNDCNGLTDCADRACIGTPACRMCFPESDPMSCTNGRDDDCDGQIDCADTDCRMFPSCAMCVPTGPEVCGDGRDNDCNGLSDCADRACASTPTCMVPGETCERALPIGLPGTADGSTLGRANDYTPMCASSSAPDVVYTFVNPVRQSLTIDTRGSSYDTMLLVFRGACTGTPVGCDDDGAGEGVSSQVVLRDAEPGVYFVVVDGWTTNAGAYRLNVRVGTPTEICGNGRDDDGNGLTDCADPVCAASPMCGMCIPTGPESVACADRRDNDCNGLTDCADPACRGTPACGGCVPTGPEGIACADGRDNDCNGLTDCADPACAAQPVCCRPTPENNPMTCADGRDDDCDGLVDCADPDCAAVPSCVTPPPNDRCVGALPVAVPSVTTGSTATATADYTPVTMGFSGCAGGAGGEVVYTFTVARPTPLTIDTVGSAFDTVLYVRRAPCETGAQVACNDDTMGVASSVGFIAAPGTYYVFVDGFGADSRGAFTLRISLGLPPEVCTNGRDDDGDGLIDCADPDCLSQPMCCTPTGPEGTDPFTCADGRDNNCNGQVDCADSACATSPMCCRPSGPENTAAACTDGRDNDCNGFTDCVDFACRTQPACGGCVPTPEVCNDRRDNDCDGFIDCRDFDCARNPACSTCVPTGTQEIGVAQCTDGIDNDCDGTTDCADSDCRPNMSGMGSECCNGRDDNGNSLIDEFACACRGSTDCAGVGSGGAFPSNTCWATTYHICAPRCDMLGGNAFCARLFMGTTCDLRTGECH